MALVARTRLPSSNLPPSWFPSLWQLLSWTAASLLAAGSAWADVGTYRGTSVFVWPTKIPDGLDARKAALGEQISQYSRLAGNMNRAPRAVSDPFWAERKKLLDSLRPNNCDCIRKKLVETYMKQPLDGYYQYGNCGEGALVSICLAKQYGFQKSDILHCQNRYKAKDPNVEPQLKHQFGLLKLGDSWYLLDRWNRFQGGLRLEPIMKDGRQLRSKWDSSRKLYRLTTPSGGNFFAGARVSEEIEAKEPTYW
jgi:hypothetical protein